MLAPLLQTKFYIPPPREHQVQRQHLIERLLDRGAHRLTLISAPAGLGKTTLVNEWLTHMDQATAWLSLDEDDNEPARYLAYVIVALQSCQEDLGTAALQLLTAPQASPKAILTMLLNDLDKLPRPIVLILDDYHVISSPLLHEAMAFLIDHLPPTLHLVITSRVDPPLPLARWRARNYMKELRADDLRFRLDEAAVFLNEVMGLRLAEDDVAALEKRTEGWIVGLQLAALSLRGREDGSAFIRSFSGSHRLVLSYLLEEVLNRQSSDTLHFLMQTAILDRMCAPLCEAVTGQADGFATLMRLEQANLFIVPLDDGGCWYRYHHLFREVLYARLQHTQSALIDELHRRACAWCEEQGFLDEALHHAFAISGFEPAAMMLERHATTILLRSELMLLRKWVAKLPGEIIRSRPQLALAHGWVLVMIGQLDAAAAVLDMPTLDPDHLSDELAGEVALLRADIAGSRRAPAALTWSQRALELLPPHREDLRVIAMVEIGLAYMRRGDLAEAIHVLLEVGRRAEAAENRFVAVDAHAALYSIYVRRAQLFQAAGVSEEALRMVRRWEGSIPPATGMIYVGLGEILYEWNEFEKASDALTQGLKLLQGTIERMPVVRGHVTQARIRQAYGDFAGALESLAQAEAWFVDLQIAGPYALTRLSAQRARLWIQQGNLEAARRWADERSVPHDTELACEHWLTLVRLDIAEYRIQREKALLSRIFSTLDAARQRAVEEEWPLYLFEVRLLLSLALHMQNMHEDAFTTLVEALAFAEPSGYIRIFLDEGEAMRLLLAAFRSWVSNPKGIEKQAVLASYANRLLALFKPIERETSVLSPAFFPPPPQFGDVLLIEPLSERELEVLRLIADGLSNREIAAALIVTVGTVKSHVNHIFHKLEVLSRTQAIVRARALGLLNP